MSKDYIRISMGARQGPNEYGKAMHFKPEEWRDLEEVLEASGYSDNVKVNNFLHHLKQMCRDEHERVYGKTVWEARKEEPTLWKT